MVTPDEPFHLRKHIAIGVCFPLEPEVYCFQLTESVLSPVTLL